LSNEQIINRFGENLATVDQRIADAAQKSGRDRSEVQLVAVSKYVDAAMTGLLIQAGAKVLGENRPQSLDEKFTALSGDEVQWHLIGHLQRNKVKKVVSQASLIHSVDSIRLIDAIQKSAAEQSVAVDVLLEVNVSGESAKHGFSREQLAAARDHAAACDRVNVTGLMCMGGLASDSTRVRTQFAELRQMRDSLNDPNLVHLSMGMSGDFEIAIEEGATLVRVGSTLFEGVPR
jgi:pyridoxal phosphate enzyme (YggS family)